VKEIALILKFVMVMENRKFPKKTLVAFLLCITIIVVFNLLIFFTKVDEILFFTLDMIVFPIFSSFVVIKVLNKEWPKVKN
jgi:hypothetical protein